MDTTQMIIQKDGRINKNIRGCLYLLFLSISISIVFLLLVKVEPSLPDFNSFYYPVAKNIVAGNGITLSNGTPATRYQPGYPILIASLIYVSKQVHLTENISLVVFFVIANGLITLIIYRISLFFWNSHYAIIPAICWMTYPFALWLIRMPDTATPFTLLFSMSTFLFFSLTFSNSKRQICSAILLGIVLGMAMLIRPIAIGLPFFMALLFYNLCFHVPRRLKILLASLIIFSSIVVILPWEIWVYNKTGDVILLSTGGSPSIRDGLTFAVEQKGYRKPQDISNNLMVFMKNINSRRSEMKSFGGILRVMYQEAINNPLAFGEIYIVKAMRSWYGTDSSRYDKIIIFVQLFYAILIIVSFIIPPNNQQLIILRKFLIFITIYYWGMTIMVLSILRYMIPIMGLLFLMIPNLFRKRAIVVI